ncbi:Sybindin-like protein [Gorgonomyces haynaldii]|nr:Sybindin-like protein [Gorgonomyces haynaldii]
MTIHSLYIFDRRCICIFYINFQTKQDTIDKRVEEDAKLVYGTVFSLKNIINKLGTEQGDTLLGYTTNQYKLHYFETAASLRFVLLTDPQMESGTMLQDLYANVYVEYVSKNPLLKFDGPISNELFKSKLLEFMQQQEGFQ